MTLVFLILLAAITWADTNFPLVLFAKIDDTFVPLSGTYLGDDSSGMSLLSHGDQSAKPIEFFLAENFIYTKKGRTPMFVGFHNGFVFGPSVAHTTFNFNHDRQILNGPFYSCDVFSNHVRGILHGHPKLPTKYCFRVEIYLLPYDKSAKAAVEPLPHVPLAFCAKFNGTLAPLSASYMGQSFGDSKMFNHGDAYCAPIKLSLKDNHVYTHLESHQEPVNLTQLKFGNQVVPTSLKLDSKWRVLNGRYYSCNLMYCSVRIIVHEDAAQLKAGCSEVEIYLLPYEQVALPNLNPMRLGMPWHLFAKFNDTFVPLSGSSLGNPLEEFKVFTYGDPSTPPIKFTLKNAQVFTKQKVNREFVGFYEGKFVIGSTTTPATLDIDRTWRVLNGPFFSCDFRDLVNDGVRGILRRTSPIAPEHCFEVEIYFLPYDRVMERPARNIPPPSSDGNFINVDDRPTYLREEL